MNNNLVYEDLQRLKFSEESVLDEVVHGENGAGAVRSIRHSNLSTVLTQLALADMAHTTWSVRPFVSVIFPDLL